MKVTAALILAFLLLISLSACSLLGGNTETGTQSENSLQNSEMAEGSVEAEGNTVEEGAANEAVLPEEPASKSKLVRVVLYFATEDNGALKEEEREVRVVDGAILKACVNALIEGPVTEGLRKSIPDGTALKGISLKDKVATVDLSGEFGQLNGSAGIAAQASIVNTLTRINGVEKVRFHVNGEELAGQDGTPLGDVSPVLLNADGTLAPK